MMVKQLIVSLLLLFLVLYSGCSGHVTTPESNTVPSPTPQASQNGAPSPPKSSLEPSTVMPEPKSISDIPYYFIAIHNEPHHDSGGTEIIEKGYTVLKQMIEKASMYNIKLTLMFTAQWADYISASPERMSDLDEWKLQGHEIAAHHHGINHGNWDGYSDYSEAEITEHRIRRVKQPEAYLGTLDDFISKLRKINPNINSGCLNDEGDKRELPDEIIYDTCSGFANFGEPGRRLSDQDTVEKGKNEYVTVGTYKGIQRKWLAHAQVTAGQLQEAQDVFDSMHEGAYGVIWHSNKEQAEIFYSFLEFLQVRDPSGQSSKTINEIIEQKLLPERKIPDELLVSKSTPVMTSTQSTVVNKTTHGRIRWDETWRGEIHVTGDIIVEQGYTLTIEPGARVLVAANSDVENLNTDPFNMQIGIRQEKPGEDPFYKGVHFGEPYRDEGNHISILVLGTLHAVGTPEQMITITSDSTKPTIYDWNNFNFSHGILSYCTVEYYRCLGPGEGTEVSHNILQHAGECNICRGTGSALIKYNTIYDAGHELIGCGGTSHIIRNNILGPNQDRAGVCMDSPEASPQIIDNIIKDCGGGIVIGNGSPYIVGNTIQNNEKGVFVLRNAQDVKIDKDAVLENNDFINNGQDFVDMRLDPAPQTSKPTGNNEYSIEPTERDVRYGNYERNVMDFWKADSEEPTPIYVFFHGGAFIGGDKTAIASQYDLENSLKNKISVASVNYRLSPADPFPAALDDSLRAIQFIRYKGQEWNIDTDRIIIGGASAGGYLSLWVAFHDDHANPDSDDPIARQSSRVSCAVVQGGPCSIEPDFYEKYIYNGETLPRTFINVFGIDRQLPNDTIKAMILNPDNDYLEKMRAWSPFNHVTSDDPPIWMNHQTPPPDSPYPEGTEENIYIHGAGFSYQLKTQKLDPLKITNHLQYPGSPDGQMHWLQFVEQYVFHNN